MRATYKGAKTKKRIRASVYRIAQSHGACYSVGKKSIWYEDGSNDLNICLVFWSRDKAIDFWSFLCQWHLDNPFVVNDGDVSAVKPKVVYIDDKDLTQVELADYEGSEFDSPLGTLEEAKSAMSSLSDTASDVLLSSPLAQYQSIEKLSRFEMFRPYRCHIISKAKSSNLANEENNQFALTWELHQAFDGLNTIDTESGLIDIPLIAIKPPAKVQNVPIVLDSSVKRTQVDIEVECLNTNVAETVGDRLKEGSTRLSGTKWKTMVHVSDAELFCSCLQWKYDDTHKKWDEANVSV